MVRTLLRVAWALPALPVATAHAQMLRGVVHDPQGRALPDATVRLVRSGVSARTNAQGEYALPVGVAGADTLLVRLIGWRPVQLVFEFDGVSDLN